MFTGDRSGDWLFRRACKSRVCKSSDIVCGRGRSAAHRLCRYQCLPLCAATEQAAEGGNPKVPPLAWANIFARTGDPSFLHSVDSLGGRYLSMRKTKDGASGRRPKFGHGATVQFAEQRTLIGSYHPSQQNTFTGRLTEEMFDVVFAKVNEILKNNALRFSFLTMGTEWRTLASISTCDRATNKNKHRGNTMDQKPENATTIFVLGLLGIFLCQILGIIAWVQGNTYLTTCRRLGVQPEGLAVRGPHPGNDQYDTSDHQRCSRRFHRCGGGFVQQLNPQGRKPSTF